MALDFDRLGFAGPTLARFREAIDRPNGIVLVTGPTGSGKTTTLYACIHAINTVNRNKVGTTVKSWFGGDRPEVVAAREQEKRGTVILIEYGDESLKAENGP